MHWSTTNPLCYGAKTRIRVAAFRKTNLSSSRRAASLGSSIRCFILSGTALRGQTKTLWLLFPKALCRQGCWQVWLFFYLQARNRAQNLPRCLQAGMKMGSSTLRESVAPVGALWARWALRKVFCSTCHGAACKCSVGFVGLSSEMRGSDGSGSV